MLKLSPSDSPGRASPARASLAILAVAALFGCAPATQRTGLPENPLPALDEVLPEEERGPPTAALLLPLSGQAAEVGQDMLDAAQMALFDVGRTELVLLPKDTGGTAEGAAAATREAIEQGADVILGPLFSSSTQGASQAAAEAAEEATQARREAVAAAAVEAGEELAPEDLAAVPPVEPVPVLSFSNNAAVSGENTWVLGYRPEEQVARVVSFARRQGLRDMAALVPGDAYGELALQAWRRTGGGAEAVVYPPDETRMTPVVRGALENRTYDALLVADGGQRLRSMSALLTYYDVDPLRTQLLGTMLWLEDRQLLRDPVLQGAWIASPPQGGRVPERFEQLHGRGWNRLAGPAYDAVALAGVLANDGEGFGRDRLAAPGGFLGHAGIFRLTPDGLAEHGLAVLEVGPSGETQVDPAPASFGVASAAREEGVTLAAR